MVIFTLSYFTLIFILGSLESEKNNWMQKHDFMRNQYDKIQKEMSNLREKMLLDEKEYQLKVKILEYENNRNKEEIIKFKDGKLNKNLHHSFNFLRLTFGIEITELTK